MGVRVGFGGKIAWRAASEAQRGISDNLSGFRAGSQPLDCVTIVIVRSESARDMVLLVGTASFFMLSLYFWIMLHFSEQRSTLYN
jgi:hypothetical protein